MLIICACFSLFSIYIFLKAKKEKIPGDWNIARYQKKLFQISLLIYRTGTKILKSYLGRQMIESKRARNIKDKLQSLEPTKEITNIQLRYNLEKINVCVLIFMAGIVVITFSTISSNRSSILINGNYIERNTYGKGKLNTKLVARIEEETIKEEIDILINERKYTNDELDALFQKLKIQLNTNILGANESLNKITDDMVLSSYISDFPFRILWECSDYTVLKPDGTLVDGGEDEKGIKVFITANVSYFDWKKECVFEVMIYPKAKTLREKWKDELIEDINQNDRETENDKYLPLPTTVRGREILWKEQKENKELLILVGLFVIILASCIGKDKDLNKKLEARNIEMMQDYSEIVSKLTLLMGAGMSIQSAWKKVAQDYFLNTKRKKRYAYEEMLITSYEMERGIAETTSYHNFAKRCGLQCYHKLGIILSQNLKKGTSNLHILLQKEVKTAYEERKTAARRLGEEAGTKLLLPMMLLFGIVIIVIVVPAFLSFSI